MTSTNIKNEQNFYLTDEEWNNISQFNKNMAQNKQGKEIAQKVQKH